MSILMKHLPLIYYIYFVPLEPEIELICNLRCLSRELC